MGKAKVVKELKKIESLTGGDIVEIPIDKLEPCEWNPQTMSETTFNQLVDEIRDDGFDEPVLVVQHADADKKKDGVYTIISGEHRYEALKVLGYDSVPCIVKDAWDETEQKLKTVRRNMLRGDPDPVKLSRLVKDINDNDGVPIADMPRLLGFDDEKKFKAHLASENAREKKQVSDAAKNAEEQKRQETQIVDNLSYLLNQIFSKFGDTVPNGYVFFWYKNRMHLMLQEDTKLEKYIEHLVRYSQAHGTDIPAILTSALDREFKEIFATTRVNPMSMRKVNDSDEAKKDDDQNVDEEEIDFGGEVDEDSADEPVSME